MRILFTLFSLLLLGSASAQQYSEKRMKVHQKEVQKSKNEQSVVWDLDTVFVSGTPFCIIVEKSNGFLEPHSYSVRSLQNKELIYVTYTADNRRSGEESGEVAKDVFVSSYNYNTIEYFTWSFSDTLQKTETSADIKLYKQLADNHLIEGDHINKAKEAWFISFNGRRFSRDTVIDNSVWRKTGNQFNGNKIDTTYQYIASGTLLACDTVSRNNAVIGIVKIRKFTEKGAIVKIMSVYLPNGKVIAEGKAYGITSNTWKVVTLKDNRFKTLTSSKNNDSIDVLKYLVTGGYL